MTSREEGVLRIKSARDSARLELSRVSSESIRAIFKSPVFDAAIAQVWLLSAEDPAAFFDDLASHWRGWKGEKSWASLEGQLSFRATCDSLGHIQLRVRLRDDFGRAEWTVEGTLELEAGQLEALARDAQPLRRSRRGTMTRAAEPQSR